MGNLLSFPAKHPRKTVEACELAQKWQKVMEENKDDLLSRTVQHINNLPNESLLIAYRVSKLLYMGNRERQARWWQDLIISLDTLEENQIIELSKVANLFAQGYVLNWHGDQMKFNQAAPVSAKKPARRKGKEAVV